MFLVCQNDSIRILPQFGSVKFFYIIKSMKLTKLGCYLLVFRANLRAFSYIFTSNNIYNGHMCVWKSHLEPRKKLIFLPQNQPCNSVLIISFEDKHNIWNISLKVVTVLLSYIYTDLGTYTNCDDWILRF